LRVKEIANGNHPFVYEDDLATKARAMIRDSSLKILPVTDKDRRLLGVVSRGDAMVISSSVSAIRVKGLMTDPGYTASVEDEAFSTVREMLRRDESCAPVVDSPQDKLYRGVLGLENFIEAIIETSPEKLAKPVEEVMSKDFVTCTADEDVDSIWHLMQSESTTGCPVIKDDRLVGIVTQKDLLESGEIMPTFESKKGRFRAHLNISSVMKTQVIAVEPEIKVIRVAKIMTSKDVGRVPVVDKEGRLVGVVTREDVARLIVK
jgi:CBS domain-containing protein